MYARTPPLKAPALQDGTGSPRSMNDDCLVVACLDRISDREKRIETKNKIWVQIKQPYDLLNDPGGVDAVIEKPITLQKVLGLTRRVPQGGTEQLKSKYCHIYRITKFFDVTDD